MGEECGSVGLREYAPAILPSLWGSLPNDIFIDVLGLKTIWVPHSYAGCAQHAPDEHLLAPIARDGLGLMAGLFGIWASQTRRSKGQRKNRLSYTQAVTHRPEALRFIKNRGSKSPANASR